MRTWIDIQVHGTEGGFDGHGSQLLMQGECSKLSIVWRAARVDGVRDTKVDAEAIHQQNGLNPSVCVRKVAGAFVGQLGKLRPIVNRPDAALAPDGGGSHPPRRLPACPTSRQRDRQPRAVVVTTPPRL